MVKMLKMLKMKNMSLFLALALVGLMYHTPSFLKYFSNTMVGRFALLVALAFTVIKCDFACAVIFALVIIVLMHNTTEGFKEGADDTTMTAAEKAAADAAAADAAAADAKERQEKESQKKKGANLTSTVTDNAINMGKTTADAAEQKNDGSFTNREPFAGKMISNVKDSLLHSYNQAQDIFKSNLLDLDREMKAGAEKRSINATKQ
jgi:hypothetical protein